MPSRHCFASKCCPESLLHILFKIRDSSKTAHLRKLPFPLRKNHLVLANCSFATIFAAPKLAGLTALGASYRLIHW
jgi:hypothetical protein